MIDNESIISDIRFITDYPDIVVSDEKVEEAIEFTKREIKNLLGEANYEFDSFPAERAIMWGSCYHLKVKSGEIGGMPMSIGDVNLESSIRSRGDPNGDLFSWAEKFWNNYYRMDDAGLGFGRVDSSRENREYDYPSLADYGE